MRPLRSDGRYDTIRDPQTQEGARAVKVEYEDLQPVITNIETGIAHGSFFAHDHTVQQGPDVEVCMSVYCMQCVCYVCATYHLPLRFLSQ